jgi:CRISPR-associated protein Cmr2
MSEYFLRISYGPVQPFISASRKTRDLKAGSDLLVQLGREMLAALEPAITRYVFPASKDGSCANILEVVVQGDPKKLAEAAQKRAQQYLVEKASRLRYVDTDLAQQQAKTFLEFYAVWTPADDEAHSRLDDLMAARKAVRSFGPAPTPKPLPHPSPSSFVLYRPKSLLLPEYDSVLNYVGGEMFEIAPEAKREYDLKQTEHLDALSLIKRSQKAAMPSTRSVAVADIPDLLTDRAREIWSEAKRLLSGQSVDVGDWLAGEMDEYEGEDLNKLTALRGEFLKEMRDVEGFRIRPYYAVVRADGDNMGKALSACRTIEDLAQLSAALDAFAEDVKKNSPGYATVVFAGGDDVLALLPMNKGMAYARFLHDLFAEKMEPFNPAPSLSVGVAFVHVKEDLREAVAFAFQMEQHAKAIDSDKDAFAIGARTRGGSEILYCDKWKNAGVVEELFDFFARKEGPRGFPYEVADEAERLIAVDADSRVARAAYLRLAEKKEGASPALPHGYGPREMARFADAMKLAHFTTRSGEEA